MPMYRGAYADPQKLKQIDTAFEYLEIFLGNQNYMAGNKLTLADIALLTSVSNFSVRIKLLLFLYLLCLNIFNVISYYTRQFFSQVFDYDISKYGKVVKWFEKVKSEIPKYEEINGQGLIAYKAIRDALKK